MEISWIVSLLLSIPIAILANILTPIIIKKVSKVNLKMKARSLARLKEQYLMIKEYKENNERYRYFVLKHITLILCFIAILVVILIAYCVIGFKFGNNTSLLDNELMKKIIIIVNMVVVLISLSSILYLYRDITRTLSLLADFDGYEKFVMEHLGETDIKP